MDTKQVLASCDVLIVEVSIPGLGIGLELGRAEARHVQIICLLKKGVSCNSSVKRNFPVIEYCDSIDMIKKLEDFLLK